MQRLITDEVYDKLYGDTKEWFDELKSDDLANILNSVYKLPEYISKSKVVKKATTTTTSSTAIGKKGENDFEALCSKLPKCYTVINTAKVGKQGDFIIEYNHRGQTLRCLVDIKNYKTAVPTAEINKFYTDLQHGTYDAGLLISYNTKFANISESILITQKEMPTNIGGVPVMFLSEVPFDLILHCIEILFTKLTVIIDKHVDGNKIDNLVNCINASLQHSATARRLLVDFQTNTNELIFKCTSSLLTLEVQIKECLVSFKKIEVVPSFLPKSVEMASVQIASVQIAPSASTFVQSASIMPIAPVMTADEYITAAIADSPSRFDWMFNCNVANKIQDQLQGLVGEELEKQTKIAKYDYIKKTLGPNLKRLMEAYVAERMDENSRAYSTLITELNHYYLVKYLNTIYDPPLTDLEANELNRYKVSIYDFNKDKIDASRNDIDYSKLCSNDAELIKRLISLDWTGIYIRNQRSHIIQLGHIDITINIKPFKTKTKINIYVMTGTEESYARDYIARDVAVLVKRAKYLEEVGLITAKNLTLNKDFVDNIVGYFNVN